MKIKSLTLENFKNQKKLHIAFGDKATNIYGANGAGKTTVLDAVSFLLWGKDHNGKTDTNMRPYDADGVLMHDVDTVVHGEFIPEDDGNHAEIGMFTLEVVYKEKWTKISGTDERKLTGNTTEYAIDGVPKKAKDYAAFIAEWFADPWFSLTSNPNAFPSLPWQEQRRVLLDLLGDVTTEDVINANPELQDIAQDLIKFGADDLKAKLSKELRMYKAQVKELPARIDERRKLLSGLDDAETLKKRAELMLVKYQEPLDKLLAERAAISNGSNRTAIEAKISEIEAKMDVIRGIRREKMAKVKEPFALKANDISNTCKAMSDQLRTLRPQLLELDRKIKRNQDMLQDLTVEWTEVDGRVFDETECPCCHRPYTPDMLEPMLERFNTEKAEKLEKLDNQGMHLSQELEKLKTDKAALAVKVNELSTFEVEKAPSLRQDNNEAMNKALSEMLPLEDYIHPETHEKFWELAESLKLRQKELDDCRLDINIQLQKKDEEIAKASVPVEQAKEALLKLKMDAENLEAIAKLEDEKKNVLLKQGEVEYRLSLVDKYIQGKMALVSEKVNSTFENVRVKLFDVNISNQGVRETCELTMDGVPYRQLSNAEKCHAGMEIIRAISDKLHLQNPVFVDNREGITDIGEWDGQVINLFVSPEDKELRIEH